MGYTIEYIGYFQLNKPLTEEHAKFLHDFSKTRHYVRKFPENDPDGIFFTDPKGELEPTWSDEKYKEICLSDHPNALRLKKEYELEKWGCIEFNDVNPEMPSFYCQWVPSDDNHFIEWNGGEKFYKAFAWIKFIIKHFLKPWGYVLNGSVKIENGSHEYSFDKGWLVIENNKVYIENDEDDYYGFADEEK